MEMFSKLTALFQQALETREPSVHLLDSFVEHWKGITNYYIETSDEMIPAKQTDIPWRLKQMLDILVYEEKQQEAEETGPCMEYLLQHKLLETLCTLGKAQYPPGMNQQVLLFFAKLLGQIQQPMLHIINVYRPVQKLIRLCGAAFGSQTEKEEVQFLFIICSKLKQDPYVLNYILESKRKAGNRKPGSISEAQEGDLGGSPKRGEDPRAESTPLSPQAGCIDSPSWSGDDLDTSSTDGHLPSPPSPSTSEESPTTLIKALVTLMKSQKSKIAIKACESLLLLVSIPKEETARCLAEDTALCQLLSDRVCELYKLIPTSLDPADIQGVDTVHWRARHSHGSTEDTCSFPGRDHFETFLAWLDFCDHLIREAQEILASRLAKAIHQQWLVAVVQPQLLQMSEAGVLVATVLLSSVVRQTWAPVLLEELVFFLLGSQRQPEERMATESHVLRYHLVKHCDHISDEISLCTLKLFEELLQKPQEHIVYNLVLRNLEYRNYIAQGAEDKHTVDTEHLEESAELEEDPFFTDMYTESDFNSSSQLLSLPPRETSPRPVGKSQVSDIVNSFLCLVPQEAKTSYHVQGSGYDTYVHDAHELFKECTSYSLEWGWPDTPKPLDSVHPGSDFYEGHLLKVLLDRITRILDQPYELNLQVTSVLSRLAVFPHPHLHEYLLDPYITLSPGSRSLFSVLIRVIGDLMQRIQHIPNFSEKLLLVRKQLMGLQPEAMTDHMTLLKGVIVLEEFCKELAAIAFVKNPIDEK
ncbi:FHF complex subunit HOOK-interacting protein 2B [Amia ocellicauda]|uniref:FHF complex subunit HOOK-interacting protein 2B n=1 Tax=Amia ocellicauda TaxID=2972642 RepID=UPI003463E49C